MKKILSCLMLAFTLSLTFHSATGYAWFGKKKQAPIRTITKEALAQKIQNQEPVQIINVLDPEQYKLGMIKGSLKIPLRDLEKRAGELDNFHEVVVYCASYQCGASKAAARKLMKMHFNVYAYEGGIKEWKEAGLPLD